MKKFGKIALTSVVALAGVSLVSCEETTNVAEEVASRIILSQDRNSVTADFTVPSKIKYEGQTYDIEWKSSHANVLSFTENVDETKFTADVHRPFGSDVAATLTATVTVGGKSADETFLVTVSGIEAQTALSTAIATVGVEANYAEAATVTLPAKSNEYAEEITFAYALEAEYASTTLVDGVLSIDPSKANEKVFLNVTATAGENTLTKAVKINVSSQIEFLSCAEALAAAEETLIYFQGRVKSIANTTYGNIYIQDEDGTELYIYGLYQGTEAAYTDTTFDKTQAVQYNKWEKQLEVGDYIYAYGLRTSYNGSPQMKNAIYLEVPYAPVGDVLELADNTMTYCYGTVTSIANTTYGNIYIQDEAGKEIYIYGLYQGAESCYTDTTFDATNAVRYDKWEKQLSVGDKIAVYGLKSTYKETIQIKNALLTVVLGYAPESTTPAEPTACTIEQVLAAEKGAYVTFTGTVESFYEEWSSYNNCSPYITDGTNKVMVFRTTTQVKVGDTVTVVGYVDVYNGTVQIAQGNAVTVTAQGTTPSEPSTPTEPSTPSTPVEAPSIESAAAVFQFGDNVTGDEVTHSDGDSKNPVAENQSYTSGNYTITLTNVSKVYGINDNSTVAANDAKGNSCLKLGTSSAAGTFDFTVAEDVTTVVIYVACYKANAAQVVVNGTAHKLETLSNEGAYTAIAVDTTTTKTVTFTTGPEKADGVRVMIDAIALHTAK